MLKIALQAIWLSAVGSVLLPALGIAAGRPDDPAELERVWQKTIVVFPQEPQVNSWTAASLAEAAGRLDLKAPLPAVVFLHGCAGIGPISSQVLVLARSLAEAGFVVFAPDGLARPRHSYCDPKTHKSSISRDDVLARIAEGRATLQRIKALPWIDSDNIFLMGHSMGGMTVANYPYDDFRGYVISGYHCNHSQDSRNSGVKLPKQKPILAIRGADDEWFAGSINERATCGDKMRDYPHAHSLNLPGGHHEVYYLPEGRAAILTFLRETASHAVVPPPEVPPSAAYDGVWLGKIVCQAAGSAGPFSIPVEFGIAGGRGEWRGVFPSGRRGFDATVYEGGRFLASGATGADGFIAPADLKDPKDIHWMVSLPGRANATTIRADGLWGTNRCHMQLDKV